MRRSLRHSVAKCASQDESFGFHFSLDFLELDFFELDFFELDFLEPGI